MSAINPDKVQFFTKHPFSVSYKGREVDLKTSDIVIIVAAAIFGVIFAGIGSVFAFYGVSYALRKRAIRELSKEEQASSPSVSGTDTVGRNALPTRSSTNSAETPSAETPVNQPPRTQIPQFIPSHQPPRTQVNQTVPTTPPTLAKGEDVMESIFGKLDGQMSHHITMAQKRTLADLADAALKTANPRDTFGKGIDASNAFGNQKKQHLRQNLLPLMPESQLPYVSFSVNGEIPLDRLFSEMRGMPTSKRVRFASTTMNMSVHLSLFQYKMLVDIFDRINSNGDQSVTQYEQFQRNIEAAQEGADHRPVFTRGNCQAILNNLGKFFDGAPLQQQTPPLQQPSSQQPSQQPPVQGTAQLMLTGDLSKDRIERELFWDVNRIEQSKLWLNAHVRNRPQAIHFYHTGPTGFLGNFAICPNGVTINSCRFRCAEAAFQFIKYYLIYRDNNLGDVAQDQQIMDLLSANGEEAFQIRKQVDARLGTKYARNWQSGVRDQVMRDVLQAKFEQNPGFKELLIATGDVYLNEHNQASRDNYWSDNANGTGQNVLGRMLMQLRADSSNLPGLIDENTRKSIAVEANRGLGYTIFY